MHPGEYDMLLENIDMYPGDYNMHLENIDMYTGDYDMFHHAIIQVHQGTR
jgi:hypothetical protein